MMKRRVLRAVCAVFLCLGIGCALVAAFFTTFVGALLRPGQAFDEKAVPVAPDYTNAAVWSALPDRRDAPDVALAELPASDQRTAPVDVFYIHPTTYVGGKWNGSIDDTRLNADTDRVATRIQASAFNVCCAIYAPRYRQANGTAFSHPSPDGQRAIDVAYGDVAQAFRFYLTHHHHDRPFIIASHSQGTVLAERLLREEISNKPVKKFFVAAYLLGGPIYSGTLSKHSPDLPPCASPTQTGCVVVWNARGPHYQPGAFEFHTQEANAPSPDDKLVCVNPLSFQNDEAPLPREANAGALFFDSAAPKILPGFASAQCQRGTLVVSLSGKPPRDFLSRLLDHALGAENYHPIEYQLFYVNLRKNAQARVAAFLGR